MKNDIILCPTNWKPPKERATFRAVVGLITQIPSGRELLYKDVLNLSNLQKDGKPFRSGGTVGYGNAMKRLNLRPGDVIEFQATFDSRGNLKNPTKVVVLKRRNGR